MAHTIAAGVSLTPCVSVGAVASPTRPLLDSLSTFGASPRSQVAVRPPEDEEKRVWGVVKEVASGGRVCECPEGVVEKETSGSP